MLCRFEDKVPLTFIMYERFYKSNIKPWNQLLKRAQFTLSFNHKLSAKAVSIKFSWKYMYENTNMQFRKKAVSNTVNSLLEK